MSITRPWMDQGSSEVSRMRDSQKSAGVDRSARYCLAGTARSDPPLFDNQQAADSPASVGVSRQLPPLSKFEIPSHTPDGKADGSKQNQMHPSGAKSLMNAYKAEALSDDLDMSQSPSASMASDTGTQPGETSPPQLRSGPFNSGAIKLPPYTALERKVNESLSDGYSPQRHSFVEHEYRRSPEEITSSGKELDFHHTFRPPFSRSRDSHFSPELHPYARVSFADARPQSLRHLRSCYGTPSNSKMRSETNCVSHPYLKSSDPPYDRQRMPDTRRRSYHDDRDFTGAYGYNVPRRHPSSGPYGYQGAPVNGTYQAWQHIAHPAAYSTSGRMQSPRDVAGGHESDPLLQHLYYGPSDPFTRNHQLNDTVGTSRSCTNDSAGEADISTGNVKNAVPNGSASGPLRRRGKLPRHITEHLKSWLMSHAEHPYPTEEEKHEFCAVTGLDINQISNWFVNARRRILNTNGSSSSGGTAGS